KWITVLESDECRINEVTEAFIEIEKVFKKELPLSDLSSSEQDKILEAVQARRKMCLKPIHFSANILHPKLKGKHLSAGEIVQGLQYIHSLVRHLSNVDENKVLENLADFRTNDELPGDPTDTSESTVALGLEEKTMATNQSEPGFSGWYSPRCVDQSSSSEDSKLYEEMDAVLYASDELEDEEHVDKDEDID
ncbi:hypothetical protein ILUMI_15807, partial [Ignelater luminosus]